MGPLKVLKDNLKNDEHGHGVESLLCKFHAIHMSGYVKSFNGSLFSCGRRGERGLPVQVTYHDDVVALLRMYETDP